MSAHPSAPEAASDRSQLAGTYLEVLGVIQLLGCNLDGLLFIWFGDRVRQRSEGFRKASLWLLGVHMAALACALLWVIATGTEGTTLRAFGVAHRGPALWLVCVIIVLMLVVLGLPFRWLWQDTYAGPPDETSDGVRAGQ